MKNSPRPRLSGAPLAALAVVILCMLLFGACEGWIPQDTSSLLAPRFRRSEIVGFIAGFGTTFAAVPDLLAMFRRRSSTGMNPRMAAILGVFQVVWVYYGFLIASRPVIVWNVIAVLINFLTVGAYLYFVRKEKAARSAGSYFSTITSKT